MFFSTLFGSLAPHFNRCKYLMHRRKHLCNSAYYCPWSKNGFRNATKGSRLPKRNRSRRGLVYMVEMISHRKILFHFECHLVLRDNHFVITFALLLCSCHCNSAAQLIGCIYKFIEKCRDGPGHFVWETNLILESRSSIHCLSFSREVVCN